MKSNHINTMLFAIITLFVIAFSQGCTQPSVPFTYHNVQEWDNLTYKAFAKCPSLPNLTSPLAGIQHYEHRNKLLKIVSSEKITFKEGADIHILEGYNIGTYYEAKIWKNGDKYYHRIVLLGKEYRLKKIQDPNFQNEIFSYYDAFKNPCSYDKESTDLIQSMSCLTTFKYHEQDSSYHIKDLKVNVR
ncbi:hypothetical protein AAG747_22625 [Rapidithrix thailandica]|uniref:Lipoprotein n=1 Tax=Rapidithrix thailandica TaxID=413964 RepID=A0AAW9SA05_9BACT